MYLFSYIAPNDIPALPFVFYHPELFPEPLRTEVIENGNGGEIIKKMCKFSIIYLSDHIVNRTHSLYFNMHSLLQEAIRNKLTDGISWARLCFDIFYSKFDGFGVFGPPMPPHALRAADHISLCPQDQLCVADMYLFWGCLHSGQCENGEYIGDKYLLKAAKIYEVLYAKAHDNLRILFSLQFIYKRLGMQEEHDNVKDSFKLEMEDEGLDILDNCADAGSISFWVCKIINPRQDRYNDHLMKYYGNFVENDDEDKNENDDENDDEDKDGKIAWVLMDIKSQIVEARAAKYATTSDEFLDLHFS